ncbi:MAG: Methylated-DNA/protein-cysteine methyltransferase [Desulfotomaculum sp. 46_296]|nr:MAG: Methylated-DNA/protein-cysteine methyltransferase [Desulfotomaculum sp. 46_296]HAU30951.1 methylated-DNA--[protein]-cysteine S-methyltransferase [Desulfotomaculum sp.]
MIQHIQTQIFKTAFGWVVSAWFNKGLAALTLPQESPGEAIYEMERRLNSWKDRNAFFVPGVPAEELDKLLPHFKSLLLDYYNRMPVIFDIPVDLSWCTPFQFRVLNAIRVIPYGSTLSYRQVGIAAGSPKSARAVGNAAGSNLTPVVIPCHRVIMHNGKLGGFSDRIDFKKLLLDLESENVRL